MSNVTKGNIDLSAEQKRELLAKLLREKARQEVTTSPLSYGQRALWFIYQLDPHSAAYNIMYAAHIRSDLNHDAFRRAFQTLLDRHPALRTTYGAEQGLPIQRVHGYQEFELEIIDASSWPQDQLDGEIQAQTDRPFDLQRGPVIRVQLFQRSGPAHVLLITAHHIAMDFWSFDLLFDELEALYKAEMTQTPATLSPLKVQYTDFVRWQQEMLDGEQGDVLCNYWLETLAGQLPNLDLPTDRARPPLQTYNGKSYHFHLPDELSQKLVKLTKSQGATLYTTLLAAFQVLLYRYSGQETILVGSPTAGRNQAELEEVIGYFLNPIVLRADLSPDTSFVDFLAQVRTTVIDGLTHQDYPFPLLVERLQPPRDASRSPLFQVAFGWDKPRRLKEPSNAAESAEVSLPSTPETLGLEPFALGQQGAAFDLMLMMLNIGDSLSAALQYNSDLFDETTVARMVGHFQTLLESIVANPQQQLADLPMLTEAERQTLLLQWNDTGVDYARSACLHELFEAQVARTPQSVAAVFGEEQLTYEALNQRSNQLARYLVARGVGPEVLVGICVEPSLDVLVGILGILKAGGAYVPLAPGTPGERLSLMLEESQAPLVLTQTELVDTLPEYAGQLICLDDDWPAIAQESGENVGRQMTNDCLAYVIFTSGSTGRPKGVQLPHRGVVNFLSSMRREPAVTEQDILLAVTTLTFDISVLELFLPLTAGAQVVLARRGVAADGVQLAQLISDAQITIMQATPATWRILIEAGWQGSPNLKILCGGEAMPRDLADQLLERCGSLWNMYGPTETTIWSAVYQVPAAQGPVSIGKPIANTQIYLLDRRLQPVPVGVPGHLHIAGDGLARGYLKRPELTAEKFIPNPFSDDPHQRLYQTGDLACYRGDGNIEFLGRLDFQVKIRGFRIELAEIEAILSRHPAVRQTVVTARQTGPRLDDKQLVAYFTTEDETTPNTSELRDFLKQHLPDYMLPSVFMSLEQFPLNPAGKVDRKALPEPDTSRPELRTEYVAPGNPAEEELAEIWASVLGLDQVGVQDNFFDLGGASIQSLEIAARASDAGLQITPAMLFQHPTISELALAAPRMDRPAAEQGSHEAAQAVLTGEPKRPASGEAKTAPTLAPVLQRDTARSNTIIESIGVYLPPKEVTTKEVLKGCKKKIWFPLEYMTGIKSRRMAGETEFSVQLAKKAADECLANSKYDADQMDLVICASITRSIAALEVAAEPSISMKLKELLGFKNAIVFDITNACTGMFTAIYIMDAFLAAGVIRRGMVVSGEHVTGITKTAQKEISEFMDPRIACLTVGDAGAAVILESAANKDVGFHDLDMYTLGKYSWMCIGKLTDQPHGGAIMLVPDPMQHTTIAVKHSVMHAKYMFERSPWKPEQMQHLIMHQTSSRSLMDGARAINKSFDQKICNEKNTINNLAERGNTASTTHFVAVWDYVFNDQINSGDKVVFGITGSGQTFGTGIYTFDDLPQRLRQIRASGQRPKKVHNNQAILPLPPVSHAKVRVAGISTLPADNDVATNTLEMTTAVAEECLANAGYDRSDIGLLIFAGMTRTDNISEPAIATMIAGQLKMNDVIESEEEKKTFAFDIFNCGIGFLNACQVATHMIQANRCRAAMVVTAEINPNEQNFPDRPIGIRETASAVILDHAGSDTGFGPFVFKYFPEYADARWAIGLYEDGKPYLDMHQDPEYENCLLKCIPPAVEELLEREGLEMSRIKTVLPPQFSSAFNANLANALNIPREKVVDLAHDGQDLFTSSLAYSLHHARRQGLVQTGDIGLIINVGSGLQVGCATYYF